MCVAICRSERAPRGDRGMTTSVQWAVLLPLLVGVLVASCDVATFLHARGVIQQAASAAAWAEARADRRPGAAHREVHDLMRPTAVEWFDVSAERDATHVAVTVEAHVRLISGGRSVAVSASAPRERVL